MASPSRLPTRCSRLNPGSAIGLAMTNKSGDNHPVHLHRHTFEIIKVGDKATAGVMKDTINMTGSVRSRSISSPTIPGLRYSTATIRITRTKASWFDDISVMLPDQNTTIAARQTLAKCQRLISFKLTRTARRHCRKDH